MGLSSQAKKLKLSLVQMKSASSSIHHLQRYCIPVSPWFVSLFWHVIVQFLVLFVCQVDRVLDATHTEAGYKEAEVKITWKKEVELILKRVCSMKRNGVLYAELFMEPVDPER